MSDRTRILFVCLGNICRSPLAEAVFRQKARERGVEDRFEIDSAGTSGYHRGDPPDRRSVQTAAERGVDVAGASRQIVDEDLTRFDYVIAMDADNYREIEALHEAVAGRARLYRLREWDPEADAPDVPDPYFGGEHGFEDVHDIVDRACEGLLEHILGENGGTS